MQTFQNHHKKYFRLHTLARYTAGGFFFVLFFNGAGWVEAVLQLQLNAGEKQNTHVNCLLKELSRSRQCKANILAHCPEN